MKKQFFNVVVFVSIFAMTSLVVADAAGNQNGLAAPLVDDSGKDRIVNIMSQIKHDVVPGTAETIDYAQTSNIDQDLNIKAIADFFGCKTVMGSAFLKETLQRPVSSIDKSGIVALRTSAVKALVENPELKAQVEAMLQSAAEQEKDVIELMSNSFRGQTCPDLEQLEALKKANNPLYPMNNFLLTNPTGKVIFTTILGGYTIAFSAGSVFLALNNDPTNSVLLAFCAGVYGYMLSDEVLRGVKKRTKLHALN